MRVLLFLVGRDSHVAPVPPPAASSDPPVPAGSPGPALEHQHVPPVPREAGGEPTSVVEEMLVDRAMSPLTRADSRCAWRGGAGASGCSWPPFRGVHLIPRATDR